MVQHLSEMIGAGVRALKIEGRMKGIHYAATAVKVYREAIDAYYADPERYVVQPHWQQELDKITSRGYCTGFYLGSPQASAQNPAPPQPPAYALAGKVIASAGRNRAHIETRNQLRVGDPVEIIKPHGPAISDRIAGIMTVEGDRVEIAQPGSRVTIDISTDCDELDLLRRAQKRHIAK
jgi:putative protease